MRILLIEDSHIDAELIIDTLEATLPLGSIIKRVSNLNDALEQLASATWQIALLDLSLPDSFGLHSVNKLHDDAPDLPIIVLTSLEDEDTAIKTVQSGVQDYVLKKELDGTLLLRLMRYAIERQRLKSKLDQAQLQLIEGERNKVMAQTASAAAHEINNPLSVISGYAEILLRDLPTDSSHHDKVDEIYQAAQKIGAIVKKMAGARKYALGDGETNTDTMVDFEKASK